MSVCIYMCWLQWGHFHAIYCFYREAIKLYLFVNFENIIFVILRDFVDLSRIFVNSETKFNKFFLLSCTQNSLEFNSFIYFTLINSCISNITNLLDLNFPANLWSLWCVVLMNNKLQVNYKILPWWNQPRKFSYKLKLFYLREFIKKL